MHKRSASPDCINSTKRRKIDMAEAEAPNAANAEISAEEKFWFQGFKLYDEMDEEIELKNIDEVRKLSENEKSLYASQTVVYAKDTMSKTKVLDSDLIFGAMGADNDEHMVLRRKGELVEIKMECAIMLEPMPPFQIVQYQFEDLVWRVSKIGGIACDSYRKSKFKHWEEMIKKPVCEASLRRMYEIGLITTLFDHLAFPNPQEMQQQYEAINDETGKKVQIPHPVRALRVWDSSKRQYVDQNGRLAGAPDQKDESEYWQKILKDLRTNYSDEMERIEKGEKLVV